MKKLKELLHKYKELITYAFYGGLTTAVNFLVFFLCSHFGMHIVPSNIMALILSIIFAFFTNKVFVFNKRNFAWKETSIEFVKFSAVRLLSGAFETGALWLIVDFMHGNKLITKFILSMVVVVCNYTLSKVFIFVEKEVEKEESQRKNIE